MDTPQRRRTSTKRRSRRKRRLPVHLTERERDALLAAAARTAPRGVPNGDRRDVAIVAIGVYAGLRVAEICHLDITDVDLEERVIRVREGKGGKDREVALHRAAVAAIAQYLARRDDDEDAMFLSRRGTRISVRAVQRMVKQLAGDAELAKKVTPHRLRHTMATLLLEATGDLRLVQEALGHESISTTQIYTFVALERQRRGIDLMP